MEKHAPSPENRIRTVNRHMYQGDSRFKWPRHETVDTHKVKKILFLPKSKIHRLIFNPIQITHPSAQPSTEECVIKGNIYLDLGSIVGESTSLAIPVVKEMWNCRIWSERFLYGWTVDLIREKDSIIMIELRRH